MTLVLQSANAFVAAEDALKADLEAEGRHPDFTKRPWPLVDAMREAIAPFKELDGRNAP